MGPDDPKAALLTRTEKPHSSIDLKRCSDVSTPYLLEKGASWNTSDVKAPEHLRDSRVWRIIAFLALEMFWFSFAVIINFLPIYSPAGDLEVGRFSTSSAALFKSGISSIGNLWQIISLLFISDLVQEIYASEWWEILASTTTLNPDANRVSTLLSGPITQFTHIFSGGRSTPRYKQAFVISLLLVALHTLAPGAVSISADTSSKRTNLTIGLLKANLTQDEDSTDNNVDPLSGQNAQISQSTATQLAQKVVRYEYVTQVAHSFPDFGIVDEHGSPNNNILFGMPPRNISYGEFQGIKYMSDAVSYDFECQWLKPAWLEGDAFNHPSNATWSFGGDMGGRIDLQSIVSPRFWVPTSFGIYPLDIIDGEGASNGSFAWFIYGLTNRGDLDMAKQSGDKGIFIDLSSLQEQERLVMDYVWSILVSGSEIITQNVSTTASVLFCDPHMKLGNVQVLSTDYGVTLSAQQFTEDFPVTKNLDMEQTSRMLGRSLNGIPWDSVVVTAEGELSTLSQLTADLLFASPEIDNTNTYYVYTPRPLLDINGDLNAYTSIAGRSAYLDGEFGTVGVEATVFTGRERLVTAWPQWFSSLFIVLVITALATAVTVRDSANKKKLVPLTVENAIEWAKRNNAFDP